MLISNLILSDIKENDPELYKEIIVEFEKKYKELLDLNLRKSDSIKDCVQEDS
jgi:hypothetical protein